MSQPFVTSIIAEMSGFLNLNVPVMVIFFRSKNSTAKTAVKKCLQSPLFQFQIVVPSNHTQLDAPSFFQASIEEVFPRKLASCKSMMFFTSAATQILIPYFAGLDLMYCLIGRFPQDVTSCSSTVLSQMV